MEQETGRSLEQKLAGMRRYFRTTQFLTGTFWCVGVLAVLGLLCFHLDHATGGLSVGARYGWRWTAAILLLVTAILALVRPLFHRLTSSQLAAQVEIRYPVLKERLLTAVDLVPAMQGAGNATSPGFSRSMASSLIRETLEASTKLDFRRAVHLKPLRTAFAVAALASLSLGVSAARLPEAFGNWMRRMANPAADIAPWAGTRVWVKPNTTLIAKNTGITLSVATLGDKAENCTLYYRPEGDATAAWKSVALKSPQQLSSTEAAKLDDGTSRLASNSTQVPNGAKFTHKLPNLTETMTFYAVANDGRSNERRVQVEERPALLSVKMRLKFPAYMRRPDQILPETTGDFAAPLGTQVEVTGKANKALKTAEFSGDGAPNGNWRVDKDTLSGNLTVRKDGSYRLHLIDTYGFDNPNEPRYEIRVLKDETPRVQIMRPGTDIDLVPNGSFKINMSANDDYGVAAMRLNYDKLQRQENRAIREQIVTGKQSLPLPDFKPERSVNLAVRWDISNDNAKPGDILQYAVSATDNDTVSGAHTGKSAAFRVRIVSVLEMQKRLKEQLDAETRALAEIRKTQIESQKQVQNNRIKPDAAKLAQAQELQRAAAQDAKTLVQRMAETSTQLENNNLATSSELKRRDAASEMMQSLAQSKMPQASEKIQNAQAAGNNKPQRNDALKETEKQQNAIRQDIEKVREMLERTPPPDQLANEAARLAQEQERLADAARFLAEDIQGTRQETKSNALTPEQKDALKINQDQQRQASAESRKLERQLEQAAQNAQERGDKQTAEALQKAAQAMKQGQAEQNQNAAQKQLQQNNPSDAANPQDKAANALKKAAEATQQATNKPQPDSPQAAADRLEKAAQQLRDLAQQQRETTEKIQNSNDPQRNKELAQRENAIRQQAQEASKGLKDSQQAQKSAQQAQQSLSQSQQNLKQNQAQNAKQPAKDAAQQLEKAAQQAEQSAQQMRQQQQAQEMAEKVERLAQTQRALQRTTERLNNTKAQNKMDAAAERELGQVSERQKQAAQQAKEMAEQFPSPAFQKAMSMASEQMKAASQNLSQPKPDTGSETQASQNRAAQTLETIARSLQQQGQNPNNPNQQNGEQQNSPPMSPQQAQQQAALGDLMLAQGLQQQLKNETQQLDKTRQQNPNQQLTPQQQKQSNQLSQGQRTAQDIAQNAAQQLQSEQELSQAVQNAAEQMGQAGQKLSQQQTGQPTQGNQENAIQGLDKAAKQLQQKMQQQQQQQQAQNNGQQQGMPQPNPKNGDSKKSLTRIEDVKKGNRAGVDSRAGTFGGLDPRTQRTLREGQGEKVPAEYQDLVKRYYRALSEKGKR